MALTIDKIKNINIPINVSRKPDNYPPSTRGISLYNDSVNLYDAISLFMASAPPATFNIGEGLLGNGSVLSPLSWAGVNHTAALSGNGSVGSPLDVADKGITLSKLAQSGATLNQIIKWDGTNWVPSNETGGATSFVPLSRELTINGVTYDLSQNRSWTINSMVYPSAGIPVSTGSAWGTSIVNNSTNWNTAYSWGNHALAGYLTSAAIGVSVQPYNANTVIDGSYVHTDNNYTTAEKSKLAGIQAGAEVNVNADWNAVSGDAQILNKPTIPLVDTVPTSGSTNAVSSGSVFTALSFKADLVGGKVPAIQLPSYVDDVLEGYYNGTSFFIDSGFSTVMTPETGKIYINLLNNTSYRYTGSVYVQISNTVSSLNDLTDVTIGTLNNGQILQYNGTTSQWENVSVTIGSGDMQKSVYDIDNDGVVDYAETIAVDVRNDSSSDTLYRGTIVYLSGSTGTHPNAVKAQANSEATSSGTFGVVINDISPNSSGLVAAMGTLHNLDTRTGANGNPNPFTSDTLLDGDVLWLDPNTAGYVTKTKPSAPNHAVFIGVVARTHPTSGRIVYKIQNGYEIEELHNVKITSPLVNNQVLRYNDSNSLWENKTLNFQVPLTLTTNGTSGVATLAGDGVLNIPNYSTVPGGSNTQVQFNNNGVFGGSSKFTWNGTDLLLNDDSNVSPSLAFKSNDSLGGIAKYSTFKVSGSTDNSMLSSYAPSLKFSVYDTNGDYVSTPLSVTSVINTLDNTLAATTITVDGDLRINNLSTVANTASALIGIESSNKTFKTSLDSSTLSLSSSGVLSGVIKTLNDLTDVVVSSPTSGQVLSYDGTNWVNSTGGGGGGTPAGNTGEIQFNNAGAFAADSNLYWDNTNKRLGIRSNSIPFGILNIKANSTEETVSDNLELATTASGTNWTGTSFSSGYTHTTGSVVQLVANNLTIVPYATYTVIYTITNRTAGSISITMGNVGTGTVSANGTFTWTPSTTTNNTLVVIPTTDFNGTIVVSVKRRIIPAAINFLNSNNAVGMEMRIIGNNFIYGINAGSSLTTGSSNIILGNEAGKRFTTSAGNILIGNNTAFQVQSGLSNTIIIGSNAFASAASSNNYSSIFIGNNTSAASTTSNGEIVIGDGTTSLGSGQTTIGNSSTVRTHLYGNLTLGLTATESANRLKVTSNTNDSTSYAARFFSLNGTTELLGIRGDGIISLRYIGNMGSSPLEVIDGVGISMYGSGTSNASSKLSLTHNYSSVNSGSTSYTSVRIAPTIDQSGTSTGIFRGIHISPTFTNILFWRAIEWTNNTGYGLYGAGTATNYLAGGLTIGNTALNSSAILQVDSTTKGFLQPVMTTTQRDAISATPATGLSIYNSSVGRVQVYNGTTWVDESKYALNRQTASYTLVLSDTGKLVETNVATANTVTVPLNSAQAFEVGARVDIIQYGAGQTTITPTAGVTIRSANGWTKINAQYGAVSLVKIGTDEWYLFGNLNA